MTTQSPDIFLGLVEVVVCYLEDGLITHLGDHDSSGKIYECGDLIQINRGELSPEPEPAVVLGFGETEEEAIQQSREYFQRLCKWDGYENASQIVLFGHDLSEVMAKSQVDIFSQTVDDSDGSSSTHFSDEDRSS